MQATSKKGTNRIEISREELWALLSFTGDTEHYSVVHFRVNGSGKLEAGASDGKRSVEAIGQAKGESAGEWAIDAAFLEKCRASTEKGQSIVLHLQKGNGSHAEVVDTESGDTICKLDWNREVASTQMSLTDISSELDVPTDKRHRGSWCAINPEVLKGLNRIRVACNDNPITIYPPSHELAPMHFEARCDQGHWKGAITPEKVVGPGDEAEAPEPTEPPPEPDKPNGFELEPSPRPEKGSKSNGTGKKASKKKAASKRGNLRAVH